MKTGLSCSVLAVAIATAPFSAFAQNVEVGVDALAGTTADDSDPTDDDKFAFGALPSAQFGGALLVQADGVLFDHRDSTVYGGALHAGFYPSANSYVGLYGSISEIDRFTGLTTARAGGEFKFGSDSVWLTGVAGYEHTESDSFYVGTTATDDVYDLYGRGGKLFSFTDLGVSPSDRLSFSVGHRYTGGRHAAAATAAIGVSSGLSFLVTGRAGSGDYDGILAGLRLRFGAPPGGKSKLLDNRLIEDLFAQGNTRRQFFDPLPPPPPPPPPPPDCEGDGSYCAT